MYVGSSVMGRMQVRLQKHLYNLTGNRLVAAAVQKHGLSNFAFILIDSADTIPNFNSDLNQDLLDMETHWIATLPTFYNIARIAGNSTGVMHNEATKATMRANYSDERKETIGALNRGKTFCPETIDKMRLRQRCALGRTLSEKSRFMTFCSCSKPIFELNKGLLHEQNVMN